MEKDPAGIQLEMNFNTPSGNRFRRCLENGVFTVLFEHAAPGLELTNEEAARRLSSLEKAVLENSNLPCALAITDRAWSDKSRRAVDYAALLDPQNRNSHLFYISGRHSDPAAVQGLLAQAANLNLANLVLVSGDHRPGENAEALRKIKFTESVESLNLLNKSPAAASFFPGTSVNPHIYSAPGLYSSLFKLIKKFNLGAQFAVTQAGFDMAQLDALRTYLTLRDYHTPLIARLMLLSPEKVEKIAANALPGIRISHDFQAILEQELRFSESQFTAAQYRRLELQAAGCKLLGYSGIQINGADTPEKIHITSERIARALKEFTNLAQWIEEYKFYMARYDIASATDRFYLFEKLLDHERDPLATPTLTEFALPRLNWKRRMGNAARRFFFPEADRQPAGERRWLKKILANCQSCDRCRLPVTQFYCPDLCPKRLANGPCGGVRNNNLCEAGNFPCVHLQIWNTAEQRKEYDQLEQTLIPPSQSVDK